MARERLYSTRELSQLWNVSQTTIKRWTLTKGLKCRKTPGGHRRFRLNDIVAFQGRRGFEASGILMGASSEFTELEIWINTKDFKEIRKFIYTLALNNRVIEMVDAFNRLYLRGVTLADFYEEIIQDLEDDQPEENTEVDLKGYRLNLVRSNLSSAFHLFYKGLEPKKQNGRTALLVSPTPNCGVALQLMACVFRERGWECLNLREPCNLKMTRECVKKEPISLLAFWIPCNYEVHPEAKERGKLLKFLDRYRIPVVVVQRKPHSRDLKKFYKNREIKTFRQFQWYVKTLR